MPSWYETAFDSFYQTLYPHRDKADASRAARFLSREGLMRDGLSVLDVCCGTGRHLVELRRLGATAVGLDLSPAMLDAAKVELTRERMPVFLVMAGMDRIPFHAAFDLAINLFTSFGYFDSDEENAAVLVEIARALKPGGRFLMDFMNAPWIRATLVPRSKERASERIELDIRRSVEGSPPRVVKRIRMIGQREEREIVESVRLYGRSELEEMAGRAGLRPLRSWGDFDGRIHGDMSPRCILLAEKPA